MNSNNTQDVVWNTHLLYDNNPLIEEDEEEDYLLSTRSSFKILTWSSKALRCIQITSVLS